MGTPHHVVIQLCELYVKLNWKAGFALELYVKLYWKAGLPVPNTDMCKVHVSLHAFPVLHS